jgi:hypothetical protein
MTTFTVGSIVWREYSWPFVQSLHRLTQLVPTHGLLMLSGDALVSRARGIVATRFLKHEKEDVLLFIDSDIQFHPLDAVRVCEQAHEIGGIVGGAYTVRRANGSFPACRLWPDTPVTFFDTQGPDLADVEYLSGGFMAIDRSVLEKVVATMPTLLHAGSSMEHYPLFHQFEDREESEDWCFVARARDVGVPIRLNPKVRLRHIGAFGHKLEDMLTEFHENRVIKVTRVGDDYVADAVA